MLILWSHLQTEVSINESHDQNSSYTQSKLWIQQWHPKWSWTQSSNLNEGQKLYSLNFTRFSRFCVVFEQKLWNFVKSRRVMFEVYWIKEIEMKWEWIVNLCHVFNSKFILMLCISHWYIPSPAPKLFSCNLI